MGERLQPGAEPRLGPAHALGDRADPAGLAREHRDDAVCLAQLVGAQHDAVVTVDGHGPILAYAAQSRRPTATTAARSAYPAAALSSVMTITPCACAAVMPR